MSKLTGGPGWSLSPAEPAVKPVKKGNSKSPEPRIYLEKRVGKFVTVISGLHIYGSERLNGIAKELKSLCGAGGTVKNGVMEVQGDQIKAVREWFLKHNSSMRNL
jgi:predicted translation initiation factor SUI1